MRRTAPPPWTLAIVSMSSVQLGSALSVHMTNVIGAAGTAWLRLTLGAVMFLVIARPPWRSISRHDAAALLALGATTGLQTIAFLDAIDRIPLGTAVGIEFLGPVSVAALRSHNRRALLWPALALLGVVLLTQPWHGSFNAAGVGFAAFAAAGWAVYIVLTQRIGDRFEGVDGLAITIPVAALVAAAFGVPQAVDHLNLSIVAEAVGLAFLLPVLPYACEMFALRRMNSAAFGTLMALEPAIGVCLGLIVLSQTPSVSQVFGVVLVVLAGAGAQRGGERSPDSTQVLRPLRVESTL